MTQRTADKVARLNMNDVVIRTLEKRDMPRAIEVWSTAFGFTDVERWHNFAFNVSDYVVGAFIDDCPQALATVIMFDMHFNDRWIQCGGIAGVACTPPMRRRGLVKTVLKECLTRLHSEKVEVSALWPFSFPFYEKMGYSITDIQYEVTQQITSIPEVGDSSAYKAVSLNEFAHLMPVHERWTSLFNMSLTRNASRWERQLARPERQFVLFQHQDGYMIWNLKDPKERTLEVVEWAFLTEKAFHDGLSLIKNCGQLAFDKAKWLMPGLDQFLQLGVSFPPAKIEIRHDMMSRIVNEDAFFKNSGLESLVQPINDPLKISGSSTDAEALGPGELLQIATGLTRKPGQENAAPLYRSAGKAQAFSIEQY